MKKKLLSTLLAVIMLLGIVTIAPITASADSYQNAMYPGDVLCLSQGAYAEFNAYSHNGQTGYVQNAFDVIGNSVYKAPFNGTINKLGTTLNVVAVMSDSPVLYADGTVDYMTVYFMHDNDISDIVDGAKISQGTPFYHPGVAGGATGAHVHLYVKRGRQTSKSIFGGSGDYYVNNALFIGTNTTVTQTGGYNWRTATPTPAGNNPIGCLDCVESTEEGKLRVAGWAFDSDDVNTPIWIHIYVGGLAGSGAPLYAVLANKHREDIPLKYPGVGEYHGFDETISVSVSGNKDIYAYAINIGSGDHAQLSYSPLSVNIIKDKTAPIVSNVTVSQVSTKGYRVTCKVTDNVGVMRVAFPTWTTPKQTDIIWHEGSLNGNYASVYIKSSDYKNYTGEYFTHIYAYDAENNEGVVPTGVKQLTDIPTEISSCNYNGNKYVVYNSNTTWTDAKKWCEMLGGHLVSITSEEEWNTVKSLLEKYNGTCCWLGAESTSGNWKWVTGESLSFSNWGKGQPDNSGGNEYYLGTYNIAFIDAYEWNDYKEAGANYIGGFVCEFENAEPTTTETEPTEPTTETTVSTTKATETTKQTETTSTTTQTVTTASETTTVSQTEATTSTQSTTSTDGTTTSPTTQATETTISTETTPTTPTTPAVKEYAVSVMLSNATANNDTNKIAEGETYSAIITPNDGYKADSIVISMGGNIITDTVVTKTTNGYIVNISNVSGDISIIAVAEKVQQPTECQHSNTKIVNKKSATYFAKGYTGDKVCADCGKVISKGKSTAMLKLKTPSNLKLKAGKKAVTVSFNKVTDAKKYQIYYKVGSKAKTITTTKLKYTIKKLTSKKIYSIKVRAVVTSGKKTATSKWSATKKVKVK